MVTVVLATSHRAQRAIVPPVAWLGRVLATWELLASRGAPLRAPLSATVDAARAAALRRCDGMAAAMAGDEETARPARALSALLHVACLRLLRTDRARASDATDDDDEDDQTTCSILDDLCTCCDGLRLTDAAAKKAAPTSLASITEACIALVSGTSEKLDASLAMVHAAENTGARASLAAVAQQHSRGAQRGVGVVHAHDDCRRGQRVAVAERDGPSVDPSPEPPRLVGVEARRVVRRVHGWRLDTRTVRVAARGPWSDLARLPARLVGTRVELRT